MIYPPPVFNPASTSPDLKITRIQVNTNWGRTPSPEIQQVCKFSSYHFILKIKRKLNEQGGSYPEDILIDIEPGVVMWVLIITVLLPRSQDAEGSSGSLQ